MEVLTLSSPLSTTLDVSYKRRNFGKVERGRQTGWGPQTQGMMTGTKLSGFSFCFTYAELGAGEAYKKNVLRKGRKEIPEQDESPAPTLPAKAKLGA